MTTNTLEILFCFMIFMPGSKFHLVYAVLQCTLLKAYNNWSIVQNYLQDKKNEKRDIIINSLLWPVISLEYYINVGEILQNRTVCHAFRKCFDGCRFTSVYTPRINCDLSYLAALPLIWFALGNEPFWMDPWRPSGILSKQPGRRWHHIWIYCSNCMQSTRCSSCGKHIII